MALTGRPAGPPLGAPPALVDLVTGAARLLCRRSGGRADVDGLALLGERAALRGLSRQGPVSCGGSTHLVQAADGFVAVSLARPDDVAALEAWLGSTVPSEDPWPAVHEMAAAATASVLDERAALLGLPVAALGSVAPRAGAFGLPVAAIRFDGRDAAARPIEGATVVDLSALWAGPLCGQLLAEAGADVIKVESVARGDGARHGPAAFFDLLNSAKRSVALNLGTPDGRDALRRVIAAADVVIESARPRALEQMGIAAGAVLRQPRGPRVWVSITSHGRAEGAGLRVGFGDVAAVAGGLVAADDNGPCFVADAVTDPVAGLVAAAAVLEALHAGGRWLLDAAMAPMAAGVAGAPLAVGDLCAAPPRARAVARAAPPLGADTAAVLGALAP
jgi:hypothetical protein